MHIPRNRDIIAVQRIAEGNRMDEKKKEAKLAEEDLSKVNGGLYYGAPLWKKVNCPNCNAINRITSTDQSCKCEFCGTTFPVKQS